MWQAYGDGLRSHDFPRVIRPKVLDRCLDPDQSGFTPVTLMMRSYFARSAVTKAANFSIDIGSTLAPASSSFCRVSASARILLISVLSRAITAEINKIL